jgi:hypothetical protein
LISVLVREKHLLLISLFEKTESLRAELRKGTNRVKSITTAPGIWIFKF